jgi:hypothetical protein
MAAEQKKLIYSLDLADENFLHECMQSKRANIKSAERVAMKGKQIELNIKYSR